jgi:hypothetical protein
LRRYSTFQLAHCIVKLYAHVGIKLTCDDTVLITESGAEEGIDYSSLMVGSEDIAFNSPVTALDDWNERDELLQELSVSAYKQPWNRIITPLITRDYRVHQLIMSLACLRLERIDPRISVGDLGYA